MPRIPPGLRPDCGILTLKHGDLLILTTDGLHDHIDKERMRSLVCSGLDCVEIVDRLMTEAVDAGSTDDLSIVLARL